MKQWRDELDRLDAAGGTRRVIAAAVGLVVLATSGWVVGAALVTDHTAIAAPPTVGVGSAGSPRMAGPVPELAPAGQPRGLQPLADPGQQQAGPPGTAGRSGDGATGDSGSSTSTPGSGGTNGGSGRISLGYYPGWVSYSPSQIDYSPWTHIGHFGIYPQTDGGLRFGNLSRGDLTPAVQAAHAAGTQIYLVIGSEGMREEFMGATRDRNRAGFVREIVSLAASHGYDGIEIDWSDPVDADRFTALIRDLRTEINSSAPGLALTFSAVSGLLAPSLAGRLHQHVDYIHLMSYWSDGSDQFGLYRDAGVPAAKLVIGIGFYQDGYYDTTPSRVQSKVDLSVARGAAGVTAWSFQHLDGGWNDPRLAPLRTFAGG
ncbi:glycoside hydrolase family 18 protein [Natronosporangium hydrolyticum]|uniref:chitinase n=1 Tax=Natronosporangium hydrolyticum TaxID=2811111 RepID=A0A895YN27_9ACTN|nr:glycoside hydrolase family 18 protein [Natronosporangium hydrolyticum]QSB15328.1 glycoside hydrolase family 18 protein [Natronosporangium hydrolyticum]